MQSKGLSNVFSNITVQKHQFFGAQLFLWNGLRHLGDGWNGGITLEFLSPFLLRAPPLEMRRARREFFPDKAGKGSLISSYEAETGLLWMWAEPSCFLSSGDGYVGELLELQQGCEGPFRSSRGKGSLASRCHIRNGPHLAWRGEPPGFSRVVAGASRVMTGTSGTLSCGLRKGQSPCQLLGGLAGLLSSQCRGLRPCVESAPEPEVSSPVLTWNLGYFWSPPRGVSRRLEWGHARALSSRALAGV